MRNRHSEIMKRGTRITRCSGKQFDSGSPSALVKVQTVASILSPQEQRERRDDRSHVRPADLAQQRRMPKEKG